MHKLNHHTDKNRYCIVKNASRWGGIHKLKEHLVGVRGQVKSCEALLDVIGPIREEMQKVLNDYQQEKAREKAIQA